MKTRILLAVIVVLGLSAATFGQERTGNEIQTIFGNPDKKIDHGGYGAFTVGYTSIDGEPVLTLGGRGGWLIDHHVTLGFAGLGFATETYIDGYWPDQAGFQEGYYMVGGYGGFFVEPIIAPFSPIHVSFPILIGGGGLTLNETSWHDYNWEYDYYEPFDWDSYFVFEPGVEVEMNVVKFFRIALGASYRLTSNLHMDYVPKDMMNGFNASMTFKFGKF
jgi:hypothetical protein